MERQKSKNRLNGKDLMNIGIFTALNFVIGILIACTIGMIPIGFMLISTITPLIAGIPMMLFFTKIKKFGMVLISQIIGGAIIILTSMRIDALLASICCALIAELILKSGKYQSSNKAVFAFAVVSIAGSANYFSWISVSAEWLQKNAASYGQAYVETIAGYFNYSWVFPVLIISAFVSGLVGGLIGKTVLKKHFLRSGLV